MIGHGNYQSESHMVRQQLRGGRVEVTGTPQWLVAGTPEAPMMVTGFSKAVASEIPEALST